MTSPSSSIKVAYITTADMGLRYLLIDQLRYLKSVGFDVIGISSPGPATRVIEDAGIKHIAVSMERHPFTPIKDIFSLSKLRRVLLEEKPSIVHTHNPKPGLLGQVAARMVDVPVIVNTIHGLYMHEHMSPLLRKWYVAVEKSAAKRSDLIISQSTEDIQTLYRYRICPQNKVRWIGNGVNLSKFNPEAIGLGNLKERRAEFGIPDDALVVGFVGRLVKEKGVVDLVRAIHDVRARVPNCHALIVGPSDPVKKDSVDPSIAARFGVSDHCHFTGARDDLPDLYALMDVFVLPSYREGFPRVCMEACAMQIPCVVTNIRGCREIVQHGENGLLVSRGNAKELAQALTSLLLDRKMRTSMALRAREIALSRFDEQEVFAALRREYERLLEQKGERSSAPTSPRQ